MNSGAKTSRLCDDAWAIASSVANINIPNSPITSETLAVIP